ncbi:hypothetical protein D3C73_802090 [compost metagenome]
MNQLLESVNSFYESRIFKSFLTVHNVLQEAGAAVGAEQNVHEQEGARPGILFTDCQWRNAFVFEDLHIFKHFFKGGWCIGDSCLSEQIFVVVHHFDIVAVRQRVYIAVKAVVIQQSRLIGVFQAVLVQHVVQWSEQSSIYKRFHLCSRVHDGNVRDLFGSRLGFELHLLLVGVQRIQFDLDVRMLFLVLLTQLMYHFVGRCRRIGIDVLEGDGYLLVTLRCVRCCTAVGFVRCCT